MSNRPPFRLISMTSILGAVLAGYWLAMFVVTHIPVEWLFPKGSASNEMLAKGGDKPVHLLAYAGLSFQLRLFLFARHPEGSGQAKRVFWVCLLYAIADELLQIPTGRTADILDLASDWAGVVVGLVLFQIPYRLFSPKRQSDGAQNLPESAST